MTSLSALQRTVKASEFQIRVTESSPEKCVDPHSEVRFRGRVDHRVSHGELGLDAHPGRQLGQRNVERHRS
jgi:hypothetical protein